jgi:hypothetical protein
MDMLTLTVVNCMNKIISISKVSKLIGATETVEWEKGLSSFEIHNNIIYFLILTSLYW